MYSVGCLAEVVWHSHLGPELVLAVLLLLVHAAHNPAGEFQIFCLLEWNNVPSLAATLQSLPCYLAVRSSVDVQAFVVCDMQHILQLWSEPSVRVVSVRTSRQGRLQIRLTKRIVMVPALVVLVEALPALMISTYCYHCSEDELLMVMLEGHDLSGSPKVDQQKQEVLSAVEDHSYDVEAAAELAVVVTTEEAYFD